MTAQQQSADSIGGRLGSLTAVAAALWLVLACPAYWLAGFGGLEGLSIAALLCLVPGWLALLAVSRFSGAGPSASAMAVALSGTLLRLLFVLVGTMVVNSVRPELGFRGFIVWLLPFYLAMLLAETLLVLKRSEVSSNRAASESNRS